MGPPGQVSPTTVPRDLVPFGRLQNEISLALAWTLKTNKKPLVSDLEDSGQGDLGPGWDKLSYCAAHVLPPESAPRAPGAQSPHLSLS